MKSLTIFTNASQQLAARLFSRGRTQADKQRGASALEYIVLAAAIVVALVAASVIFGDEIPGIFQDLFDQVPGDGAGTPE